MIEGIYDEVIGFTGHQALSPATIDATRAELTQILLSKGRILGLTSLASGSDQIFAECVRVSGNQYMVIVPCRNYESSFSDPSDLVRYRELLLHAAEILELSFLEPSEEAFWAAGKHIADMADSLLAVWDGKPSAGLGGTADVVEYAKKQKKPILRVWPKGSTRQ
jgi:hypothetical protein